MLRRLEYVYAFIGLLFMAGAFTVIFTPDGARESAVVRTIGTVIGLLAVALLGLRPRTFERALAWYWPTLVPCVLALASYLWSVNSDLTLRRGGALLLSTAFAIWLVERFKPQEVIKLLLASMFALCIGCLFIIFVNPKIGVHQGGEFDNIAHIGAWRGLFGHKNDFGRACAFAGTIFIIAAVTNRKYWLVGLSGFIFATVLVFGSRSSQAILLLFVPSAIAILAVWLRNMTAQTRAVTVTISLCASVVLYFAAQAIASEALALLGKDETMSGRTSIWITVLEALDPKYYVAGGGYGAGWELVVDRITTVFGPQSFQHAHNGYVDLMLSLGVIGVLSAVNVLVLLLLHSFRATFNTTNKVEVAPYALAAVIFTLSGNYAASFLLDHNSIYWVMVVVFYCMLRRPLPATVPDGTPIPSAMTAASR